MHSLQSKDIGTSIHQFQSRIDTSLQYIGTYLGIAFMGHLASLEQEPASPGSLSVGYSGQNTSAIHMRGFLEKRKKNNVVLTHERICICMYVLPAKWMCQAKRFCLKYILNSSKLDICVDRQLVRQIDSYVCITKINIVQYIVQITRERQKSFIPLSKNEIQQNYIAWCR